MAASHPLTCPNVYSTWKSGHILNKDRLFIQWHPENKGYSQKANRLAPHDLPKYSCCSKDSQEVLTKSVLSLYTYYSLTFTAPIYVCMSHGDRKSFFQFEIIINALVSSLRFIWIHMLWVYSHSFFLFLRSPHWKYWRLKTSESDVFRRQILTSKDGPRAERVKCCATLSN